MRIGRISRPGRESTDHTALQDAGNTRPDLTQASSLEPRAMPSQQFASWLLARSQT